MPLASGRREARWWEGRREAAPHLPRSRREDSLPGVPCCFLPFPSLGFLPPRSCSLVVKSEWESRRCGTAPLPFSTVSCECQSTRAIARPGVLPDLGHVFPRPRLPGALARAF